MLTEVPPQIHPFSFGDEAINSGELVTVNCAVSKGDFPIKIKWTLNNRTTNEYDGVVIANTNKKVSQLTIESAQAHHSGEYVCVAENNAGTAKQSAYLNVNGSIKPTSNVAPKAAGKKIDGSIVQEYAFGFDAIIPCDVTGYPVPRYRWYKFIDGTNRKQAVILNDRVKQVAGTLIIREAKVEDSGKYLCVVNNSVGGESVETVLTVTAPLKAKIDPPIQTIDFGRPAVFTCKFEGNPIKTVSWLKDGNPIDHSDPVLKIEAVRKEDKGMYQCFIRNDQESAEATAELKLGGRFEPPQIRHAFNEETVQSGNSVFMKCIASGNPTPEITWELYGRRLANSDVYQIGQYVTVNGDVVSHLNISSIHTNDGGLYRCVASSKVGSADHSARINVYGLPFVRSMEKQAIVAGGTLIVHCPFAGHPVEAVVWERDGRLLPINRKQKVFPNGTLIIENVERASDQDNAVNR
uniref:Down syndrome cell adhesion molecule homolog n=1 Tax=Diabrotica virgifera virgifera TaxID=50390 RepID=A0A6P7G315_DIAVI